MAQWATNNEQTLSDKYQPTVYGVDVCNHVLSCSTSLLLSTLLTMTSWSPACHPGFISMALLSAVSSCLSSCCFCVKCWYQEDNLSSWYTSFCGVPQGSVLGPLLFFICTIPVSTLISSCSWKIITSMQMTLNSYFPSFRLPSIGLLHERGLTDMRDGESAL